MLLPSINLEADINQIVLWLMQRPKPPALSAIRSEFESMQTFDSALKKAVQTGRIVVKSGRYSAGPQKPKDDDQAEAQAVCAEEPDLPDMAAVREAVASIKAAQSIAAKATDIKAAFRSLDIKAEALRELSTIFDDSIYVLLNAVADDCDRLREIVAS